MRKYPLPIRILTTTGLEFAAPTTVDDASWIGRQWNAIRRFLDTGDFDALEALEGTEVTVADATDRVYRVVLETDLDAVEAHAIRGNISFESIYDEVQ